MQFHAEVGQLARTLTLIDTDTGRQYITDFNITGDYKLTLIRNTYIRSCNENGILAFLVLNHSVHIYLGLCYCVKMSFIPSVFLDVYQILLE